MANGLIETAAQAEPRGDRRFYGVCVGLVIDVKDLTGGARVQVRLPWLSGLEPWARVASPSAGSQRGIYFIPQEGDEVLVAFNHGDLREAYILGSLWNGKDRPPATGWEDPVTKRIIRTPQGHNVEFDDARQSITITSMNRQKITLDPQKIEVAAQDGVTKLTIDEKGNVTLAGAQTITFKAPAIRLEGESVDIETGTRTSINGGESCDLQAGVVRIN